jgi:hypothetical protein
VNHINRRSVVLAGLGAAGGGALTACGSSSGSGKSPGLISPSGAEVTRVEKKRTSTGTVHRLTLTAASAMIDPGAGNIPKT